MCGIAGAVLKGEFDPTIAVRRMCERMHKRGPDAQGEWVDQQAGLALGHRRLAIIDLSARANQPFVSSDGRFVIVFNGEIYNYKELGAELKAQGVRLRTTSDTEVVVELYAREGAGAFARLRGMFALAIWELDNRTLVLARDPYGIKPLYVADTGKGVLFASQVKALLASGVVSEALEPAGAAGFYIWGSVPEPFTLYRQVQAVPAGAYTVISGSGRRTAAYTDLNAAWRAEDTTTVDLAGAVRSAMRSTVQAHLVADVPVAILLSGGVDSGVLAGLMAEHGQAVEGVTIRFPQFDGNARDEVPRATMIARAYGLKHTVRSIEREEFLQDVPLILDAMDQPTIDGVNTWFASKAIAERGYKVALSGVGGDEVFCGYSTFRSAAQLHRVGRLLQPFPPVRGLAELGFGIASRLTGKPKLAAVPSFAGTLRGAYTLSRAVVAPSEVAQFLPRDLAIEGVSQLAEAKASGEFSGASSVRAVAMLESTIYLRNQLLRDSDWASMGHSLELRTPFVDRELHASLAPLADRFMGGVGKRLLGNAPEQPLPAAVLHHPKTGFGLPIGDWLTGVDGDHAKAERRPWARTWARSVGDAFGLPRA